MKKSIIFLSLAFLSLNCVLTNTIEIWPAGRFYSTGYKSCEFTFQIYAGGVEWHYKYIIPAYVKLFKIDNNLEISFGENKTLEDLVSRIVITAEGFENDTITLVQHSKGLSDILFLENECYLTIDNYINIDSKIINQGESDAKIFYVSYYLSPMPTLETYNIYKMGASKLIRNLYAGDTLELSFSEEIDYFAEKINEGEYYIICVIDAEDYLEEDDEDHNLFIFDETFENKIVCTDDFEPDNNHFNSNKLAQETRREIHCIGDEDKDFFKFDYLSKTYYFSIHDKICERGYYYLLDFSIDYNSELLALRAFTDYPISQERDLEIILYNSDMEEIKNSLKKEDNSYLTYFLGWDSEITSMNSIIYFEEKNDCFVSYYDLSGKIIYKTELLPNRIYFVKFSSGKDYVIKKFVKNN